MRKGDVPQAMEHICGRQEFPNQFLHGVQRENVRGKVLTRSSKEEQLYCVGFGGPSLPRYSLSGGGQSLLSRRNFRRHVVPVDRPRVSWLGRAQSK